MRDFLPQGERRKRLMSLSLPIIGGMVSQNVLNLVDTAMVGSLGDVALASVGLGSFAHFMAISFFMGMSSGVQAMSARRMGAGQTEEIAVPLNGALLFIAAVSIPLTVGLIALVPYAFPLIADDPAVAALGGDYLQIRLLSLAAVGANFAFRGYWNAVNRARIYMRTLIVMHITNIIFNYIFIFGAFGAPEMGASGAAMGSVISTWLGLGYYVLQGLRMARGNGFLSGIPSREEVFTMLRLSTPAGVERFFFSASLTLFFAIVGLIGTSELAAANVLIQIALVFILPGLAFGIAAGSLAGQALGRGDPADARNIGWETVRLAAVLMGIVGAVMFVLAPEILSVFIKNPDTLDLAIAPMRLMAALVSIDTVTMVLTNVLLGVGASGVVMVISIGFQWGIFLPLVYLVGPVLGWGLLGVWGVQTLVRGMQAVVMGVVWERGKWQSIKV